MNNTNYDVEFANYVKKLQILSQKTGYVPQKLLLHACCAPCSTYCLTQVLPHFDVTLYYSNDNITCLDEWQKRLDQLTKLVDAVNSNGFDTTPIAPLKLVVAQHQPQRFYNAALGYESEPEGGKRCEQCFALRLADTRDFAVTNGFDLFATTLSVSPYKNSKLLNKIGLKLQNEQTKWLPADFKKRDGYKQSIALSQKYDLYRQHYCGCEFSMFQG